MRERIQELEVELEMTTNEVYHLKDEVNCRIHVNQYDEIRRRLGETEDELNSSIQEVLQLRFFKEKMGSMTPRPDWKSIGDDEVR